MKPLRRISAQETENERFASINNRTTDLRKQYEAGKLTKKQFQKAALGLATKASDGSHWMCVGNNEWYRHNGEKWLRQTPPCLEANRPGVVSEKKQRELETCIARLEQRQVELTKKNAEIAAGRGLLLSEIDSLTASKERLLRDITSLQSAKNSLIEETESLAVSRDRLNSEIRALIAKSRKDVDNLGSQIEDLENEVHRLTTQRNDLDSEIQRLKKDGERIGSEPVDGLSLTATDILRKVSNESDKR